MLQVIQHTDGRKWLRKDGKLILAYREDQQLAAFIKMDYAKLVEIGGTGKKRMAKASIAGALIQASDEVAKAPQIVISHPQFVQPYQWA